jgi:hypothetical protein
MALLLVPPIAWGLHTLVSYLIVTLDCLSDWNGSTTAVLIVTGAFAAASALSGFRAWRFWQDAGGPSRDPREPRPFIFALTLAGSALFTAAILLAGSTPLLTRTCESGTLESHLSSAPSRADAPVSISTFFDSSWPAAGPARARPSRP